MSDLHPQTPDTSQREALVSLTALYFIEEHALLARDQLEDARQSLQALFLRTSGEETMLRKLIETLKATRRIHQSFAGISSTLAGVSTCVVTLNSKIMALREELERDPCSPEENAAFVGPFLDFSHAFANRVETLHRGMHEYLAAKESEAKSLDVYRIARAAREQLKRRLAGSLGSDTHGPLEAKIKQEVVAAFDFSEAESNLRYARRQSRNREAEVRDALADLKAMSQMAMNPHMREQADHAFARPAAGHDDIFARYMNALPVYPRLDDLKPMVVELFKMYQRAYGMFDLDFQHLSQAAETMLENAEAYFEAKEEDQDVNTIREKLRKIEGLIAFLETAVEPLRDPELDRYYKFSRRISEIVSAARRPWEHIAEHLLRAKVQAEAELSTRL